MGYSPWFPKTWRQLAEVKSGAVEIEVTPWMMAGSEAEPRIKELYEYSQMPDVMPHLTGTDMVVSRGIFSASLDWGNFELTRIAEFKTPSKGSKSPLWKGLKDGVAIPLPNIPDHYYAQMQHQLMVSGAEYCDFVVYAKDIDEITIQRVRPEENYHWVLQTKWEEFWSFFSEGKLPPLMHGDVVDKSDNADLVALVEQHSLSKVNLTRALEQEKNLREQLYKHAPTHSVQVNGTVIERVVKRGSVDWKRLQDDQQLADSLVERYRKPSTMYHRIRESKDAS